MKRRSPKIILTHLLLAAVAVPCLVAGQTLNGQRAGYVTYSKKPAEGFLTAVRDTGGAEPFDAADSIVSVVLQGKTAVLIDAGLDKDAIVRQAAAGLAERSRTLYAVNWERLLNANPSEAGLSSAVDQIIADAAASKGKTVLYIEDIAGFAKTAPAFGRVVAERLYDAIASGKVQAVTAADAARFVREVTNDAKLRRYVAKVELNETDRDPFVGDKLSPDLREMLNGAGRNSRVKVILQADDINDPRLMAALEAGGAVIESRAEGISMLTAEMPASTAETVAALRGSRHLSLDREISTLGHVETTTGADLVRVIEQGLQVGLLGTTIVNTNTQLDGRGIGIAIVDSSIREAHRSFVDASGKGRIVQRVSFVDEKDKDMVKDEFGHGTHVASLAAGGAGQNMDPTDGLYLGEYSGIAPSAKIINVQVLSDKGVGSTSRLLLAVDWILRYQSANNIRVVNLSLGAPAIESWRNDPLCRAVRKLTAAGIVVVAAAGNNGKTASGQKIYGAIHSPGNDPTVITVGAANTLGTDARDDDRVTTFSSRGPTRSFWTDTAGVRH